MQRYFIDKELFFDSYALIKEDYHHIKNVMRFNIGDELIVSTGDNKAYLCTIDAFLDKEIRVNIIEQLASRELEMELIVAVGLMNNNKMELIIQKLTEIGVSKIIPVNMQRSIVKDKGNKQERFNKIAKEAAEQSHRSTIPFIEKTCKLKDLPQTDLNLYAYEASTNYTVLKEQIKNSSSICVLIGPEGGIDLSEIKLLKEKNYQEISLGRRILRAETAAIVAASHIAFIKEMF